MDRLVFNLKSTTLCQAPAKEYAVCLIESQDPCSTQGSEIEKHSNRDATVKSIYGDCNSQEAVPITWRFFPK